MASSEPDSSEIEPTPIPAGWTPLLQDGTIGAEAKILLASDGVVIGMLRLAPASTTAEQVSRHEIDVICLEGEGLVAVEDRVNLLAADQRVRWPRGRTHRLWTAATSLTALVVEHID